MKKIIISIDGPAASGKGKIAKYISEKWKYKHIESGIIYTTVLTPVILGIYYK